MNCYIVERQWREEKLVQTKASEEAQRKLAGAHATHQGPAERREEPEAYYGSHASTP